MEKFSTNWAKVERNVAGYVKTTRNHGQVSEILTAQHSAEETYGKITLQIFFIANLTKYNFGYSQIVSGIPFAV